MFGTNGSHVFEDSCEALGDRMNEYGLGGSALDALVGRGGCQGGDDEGSLGIEGAELGREVFLTAPPDRQFLKL